MSVNYNQNIPNTGPSIPAGDPITELPIDQELPNKNEIHIVNTLFQKNRGVIETILEDSKDALLVGVLVILFSLPTIDRVLHRIVPITSKSSYILVLIKGLVAVILFWLVKYFYLSRK